MDPKEVELKQQGSLPDDNIKYAVSIFFFFFFKKKKKKLNFTINIIYRHQIDKVFWQNMPNLFMKWNLWKEKN
jgi:hypothetical protein